MAKVNSERNLKLGGNGKTPAPPQRVELTLANAPMYQAKFLEGILIEFQKLNKFLETHQG
jgi:hypothetical protein